MGGSALKRKRSLFLKWSLVIGVLTSVVLGYLMYALSRH